MLRAEALWVETFTGLRSREFEGLLRVVCELGGSGPGGGRPWCPPLADRVLLVAVQYRIDFGVWVGDTVGEDVELVVVGRVDDGGQDCSAGAEAGDARVVRRRPRSCWSRSVVDVPP